MPAGGDDEPERLSRLRWLDSRLAQDDGLVPPYTPVVAKGRTLSILGRTVELDASGFPRSIRSRFTPEVTSAAGPPRELLAAAIALVVEGPDGARLPWTHDGPKVTKQAGGRGRVAGDEPGRRAHRRRPRADRVRRNDRVRGRAEGGRGGGPARRPPRAAACATDVARYAMGLGWKGGTRPDRLDWTWDVAKKNQDAIWVGDVNAGVQLTLKDDRYERPLNTNFYLSKPLVLPASWGNGGKGTCSLGAEGGAYLVRCGSGPRRMEKGETQRYDFRLALTPFKPIDTDAQWTTRFYHRYAPLDEIQATGANVVNVHHATPVNPWINYPFLRPAEMKAYVDAAHARGMKVKIYYTVREISNRAPELWALRSLGHEVFSGGPGGGWAWLQEHVGGDYIGGWFVPEIQDAALVTSGISRWHNYYVEGLDWLARNVGIDGLYLDDVAFDRTTMKRVRKVLDRRRPGALIDLHSANQYNPRDGFASSANLYLEHLPFVDRLWFGEYFDYDAPPDYLARRDLGRPVRPPGRDAREGRQPLARDAVRGDEPTAVGGRPAAAVEGLGRVRPRGIAHEGLVGSRRAGADGPAGRARHDLRQGRPRARRRRELGEGAGGGALAIDWKALGLDPSRARLTAPAIEGFQPAGVLRPDRPHPRRARPRLAAGDRRALTRSAVGSNRLRNLRGSGPDGWFGVTGGNDSGSGRGMAGARRRSIALKTRPFGRIRLAWHARCRSDRPGGGRRCPMTAANVVTAESQVDRPVAVWIEDGEGTIVRGVAESVTRGGAHIRLSAKPGFGQGTGVALRICFDPDCPTVATSARVSWVRSEGGQAECGVEWTGARATLDEWLASRN